MNRTSVPTHANVAVIEAAYERWSQNPDSVDPTWRAFYQGFTLGSNGASPTDALASAADSGGRVEAPAEAPVIDSLKQSRVHHLISTYRSIGHLEAHLDALS